MKKILTLLSIAIIATASAQAQTIKLMKDGQVVATYSADMVDAVVFSPEGQPGLDAIAGTYDMMLSVSLVEMPAMGVVATLPTKVIVTAASDDKINITLPAVTYVMQGTPMSLPSVEVKDIDVTITDGVYTFSTPYSGVEEATSKAYSGTIAGTITSDRTVEIASTMKYGTMPFTLNMQYTNIAAE